MLWQAQLNAVKAQLASQLESNTQLSHTNEERAHARRAAEEQLGELEEQDGKAQLKIAELASQLRAAQDELTDMKASVGELTAKAIETLQASAAEAAKHAEVSLLHCSSPLYAIVE